MMGESVGFNGETKEKQAPCSYEYSHASHSQAECFYDFCLLLSRRCCFCYCDPTRAKVMRSFSSGGYAYP
jgi:hypothetical protein